MSSLAIEHREPNLHPSGASKDDAAQELKE
jgi:hypothetical protein